MDWNEVMIAGRLTHDPDIRETKNGDLVANLSIAVNRQWQNRLGERQEQTAFIRVTAWSYYAGVVKERCKKGTNVFIKGYLTTENWETSAGEKRSRLKVTVRRLLVLDYGKQEVDQEDEVRDED